MPSIFEAIVRPPFEPSVYLRTNRKILNGFLSEVGKAAEECKTNDAGYDMFYRFIKGGSYHTGTEFNDRCLEPKYIFDRMTRNLADVVDTLDSVMKFGANFLKYLLSSCSIEQLEYYVEQSTDILNALKLVDTGAYEYGYRKPTDYDDEYKEAMVYAGVLKRGAVAILGCAPRLNDIRVKMGEFSRRSAMGGDRYRPDHEEVETLYHASAYCSELVRDGFSAEQPESRKGLGNFGQQKEISFTHSLKIAHDIARCLKEVCMIANGELTARDIAKWIAVEKIDPADIEHAVGASIETGEPEHPLFGKSTRLRKISEYTDVTHVAKMYGAYLAFSKLRTNPVFTSIHELVVQLKGRSARDIGIISADVRLDKKDEYLYGESEFRVPADRVSNIKRIS
jgi:hypothetical protein